MSVLKVWVVVESCSVTAWSFIVGSTERADWTKRVAGCKNSLNEKI